MLATQKSFIFTPNLGVSWSNLNQYLSDGVVQPPTRYISHRSFRNLPSFFFPCNLRIELSQGSRERNSMGPNPNGPPFSKLWSSYEIRRFFPGPFRNGPLGDFLDIIAINRLFQWDRGFLGYAPGVCWGSLRINGCFSWMMKKNLYLGNGCFTWKIIIQIARIPKPEWFGHFGGNSPAKPSWWGWPTGSLVAIIWPEGAFNSRPVWLSTLLHGILKNGSWLGPLLCLGVFSAWLKSSSVFCMLYWSYTTEKRRLQAEHLDA